MRTHPYLLCDPQQRPPSAWCSRCGGELYDRDEVFLIAGEPICPGCLEGYALDYFSACRTTAGRMWKEAEP